MLRAAADKKSVAGRKLIDAIVLFRMLVLASLYNLSDEQAEYQVRDRLSFTRFLKLGLEDRIPDATTLWLFREKLAKAGLIDKLFARFGQHLEAKGYIAGGGQMVDATIVTVPKARNSCEDNEAVKAGETPAKWEANPAKLRPIGVPVGIKARAATAPERASSINGRHQPGNQYCSRCP